MKTAFLITARLKSKRLPKKIMLEVLGKPLIVHMLDRIRNAKHIGKIVICTSTNPQDDPLEDVAESEGVHCHRGSEDDVLERLLEASSQHELDHFANITADCPIIDPSLIDRSVEEYDKTNADLVFYNDENNDVPFNCYVMKVAALKKLCEEKDETDTECWGSYFTSSDAFKIHQIDVEKNLRHPTLKTSLDYPEDYEFMKEVFHHLYIRGKVFSMLDIIDLVKQNPDMLAINANSVLVKRWRDHQQAVA